MLTCQLELGFSETNFKYKMGAQQLDELVKIITV